jgi:hypothetical protein
LIVDVPFTYKLAGTKKGGRKRHRLTVLESCPQEIAELSAGETTDGGRASFTAGPAAGTATYFRIYDDALWIPARTQDLGVSAVHLHLSEPDEAISFEDSRIREVLWSEREGGMAEAVRIAASHIFVDGMLHRRTPGPRICCRLEDRARNVSIGLALPELTVLPPRTTTPAAAFAASTLTSPLRIDFLKEYSASSIKKNKRVDMDPFTLSVDPSMLRDGGEAIVVSARCAFGSLVSEDSADKMNLPFLESWLTYNTLPLSDRLDCAIVAPLLEHACTDPTHRVALSGTLKSLLRSLDVCDPELIHGISMPRPEMEGPRP